MSYSHAVPYAITRIKCRDPTHTDIYLYNKKYTDSNLAELVDYLLAHPDAVAVILMDNNQLTDKTGVKLARYVAASSTIRTLGLSYNKFDSETYLAMANALRVNTSLRELYLFDDNYVDESRIDAAFIEALRLNPDRPAESKWRLYPYSTEFNRLKDEADALGHPTLQMILNHELEKNEIKSVKRIL